MTNMHAYDARGAIKRYSRPEDIVVSSFADLLLFLCV